MAKPNKRVAENVAGDFLWIRLHCLRCLSADHPFGIQRSGGNLVCQSAAGNRSMPAASFAGVARPPHRLHRLSRRRYREAGDKGLPPRTIKGYRS